MHGTFEWRYRHLRHRHHLRRLRRRMGPPIIARETLPHSPSLFACIWSFWFERGDLGFIFLGGEALKLE